MPLCFFIPEGVFNLSLLLCIYVPFWSCIYRFIYLFLYRFRNRFSLPHSKFFPFSSSSYSFFCDCFLCGFFLFLMHLFIRELDFLNLDFIRNLLNVLFICICRGQCDKSEFFSLHHRYIYIYPKTSCFPRSSMLIIHFEFVSCSEPRFNRFYRNVHNKWIPVCTVRLIITFYLKLSLFSSVAVADPVNGKKFQDCSVQYVLVF